MRLPDIPLRHHRTVRTAAALGTGALALVRRRDVPAERRTGLRAGTALANAGLTWLTGSSAFLGRVGGSSGLNEFLGAISTRGSGPVRYASSPAHIADVGALDGDADADTWWDEHARVTSPAFLNLVTAAGAGAASWALWPLTERLAEKVDEKLPSGVGRGLNAVVNGGLVALTAVLIDKVENWADDGEELNYAPLEIELPSHIRESVDTLLSLPHPNSEASAEAVREQFASAKFFVWVTYPDSLNSGDEPVVLDPEQIEQLLKDEDIASIDVRPDESTPSAAPARHIYPVTGITGGGAAEGGTVRSGDHAGISSGRLELTLDIVDGRLTSVDLNEVDDEPFADLLSAEALRESVPGTLHPGSLDDEDGGYSSSFEIADGDVEDAVRTLERWPRPDEYTFRADGS
ncbi:hypothetical protein BI49514_01541 [Brevibacterium iodinum ATCC 49514]|uniref:Uncharacterized protein n=1 Tax=Brevibacterium iodinum ATCC 49514 TaxID=1255616 RepID=A0A2H1J1R4_9MICO|nr:hypothetical protein [Brevibacterium iodinum]SMX81363.1 hypothetical protein BI49514_01541 [Brevibacterium iodinum ATCC 49514]SUW11479.1 Uncharacterised protein [Brevibacterium iodinum]